MHCQRYLIVKWAFLFVKALLDRQQSTVSNKSERKVSIRRTSVPVPPRKASISFPDPLFDPELPEEPPSTLTRTQLIWSRIAILLVMVSILIVGILCRLFFPPSHAESSITNSTTTVTPMTSSNNA